MTAMLYILLVIVSLYFAVHYMDYRRARMQKDVVEKILGDPEIRDRIIYEIRKMIRHEIEKYRKPRSLRDTLKEILFGGDGND